MNYKKTIIFGLSLVIVCSMITNLTVIATEDTVYNWYCKRNQDHKQPIADDAVQWIEQYDGHYIDHVHDDDNAEKVLYLTFDAGYENGNVEKILDVLKEEKVSGAFFILGHLIQSNPDLIQRMRREGHTVCNHSNHHPDMTTLNQFEDFQTELRELETLYSDLVGEPIAPYYRPPEGKFDERSLKFAQQMGYQTIFWSFAYADWDNGKQPSPESAKQKIFENLHNGAILLLHPTSKTNAMILSDVIRECKAQGYRFGTLDELTGRVS